MDGKKNLPSSSYGTFACLHVAMKYPDTELSSGSLRLHRRCSYNDLEARDLVIVAVMGSSLEELGKNTDYDNIKR